MKNLALVFIGFLIFSCSTQTVSVDFDRSQDFSKINDYKIEMAENSMSELDINRIQTAIQNELSTKSMQLNPNSENKIIIRPEEYLSKSQNSSVGIGVGSGSGNFGTSIGVGIPITKKKLNQTYLVSLYNQSGNLVWDGRLEIQMPADGSSNMLESSVEKGVQKLFKKYPPKK
ncbi:MAG: DUF4136 domain-containing protein [Weeksellaceae bacterium]|nr:DUF4136 domain-containing protein [Weeksellaceae bacterium]